MVQCSKTHRIRTFFFFVALLPSIALGADPKRRSDVNIFDLVPTQSHYGESQVAGMSESSMRAVVGLALTRARQQSPLNRNLRELTSEGVLENGVVKPEFRNLLNAHLEPALRQWFQGRRSLDAIGYRAPGGQVGLGDGHHRLMSDASLIERVARSISSRDATPGQVEAVGRRLARDFNYSVNVVEIQYNRSLPEPLQMAHFVGQLLMARAFFLNKSTQTAAGLTLPTGNPGEWVIPSALVTRYMSESHPNSFLSFSRNPGGTVRRMANDPLRTAFGVLMAQNGIDSTHFANYVQFRIADLLRDAAVRDPVAAEAIRKIETSLRLSPPDSNAAANELRRYLLDSNGLGMGKDSILSALVRDMRGNIDVSERRRMWNAVIGLYDNEMLTELAKIIPKRNNETPEAYRARLTQMRNEWRSREANGDASPPREIARARASGDWNAEKALALGRVVNFMNQRRALGLEAQLDTYQNLCVGLGGV